MMLKPSTMEDFIPSLSELADDLCVYLASKSDSSNFVDRLPYHLYRFSFEGRIKLLKF